jgi:hypothetical protein
MNFRFDINIKLELGFCETVISYLFFMCKIVLSDYWEESKPGPCLNSLPTDFILSYTFTNDTVLHKNLTNALTYLLTPWCSP